MRGVCQPTWEFKSPLSHQNNSSSVWRGCYFYSYRDLNSRGLLETCRWHVSTRGGPAPQRGFKSPLSHQKRTVRPNGRSVLFFIRRLKLTDGSQQKSGARTKSWSTRISPVTPTFDLAFDSAVSLSEAASCFRDLSQASMRCAAVPMSQAAVYRPRRDKSASG